MHITRELHYDSAKVLHDQLDSVRGSTVGQTWAKPVRLLGLMGCKEWELGPSGLLKRKQAQDRGYAGGNKVGFGSKNEVELSKCRMRAI